jgi:parallel beta-helix repeat protein
MSKILCGILIVCVLVLGSAFNSLALDIWGTIDTDTTWTTEFSPYTVTGNITVAEGVTLSINPNVVVKVDDGLRIQINGTLDAEAVTFTWADGVNEWAGIQFYGSGAGTSHLSNCTIEHAEGYSTTYRGVIHLFSNLPGTTGIVIADCEIINCPNAERGIYIQNYSPQITGNTIDGLMNYGIYVTGNSSPTVTGNTLSNNGYGARINYGPFIMNPIFNSNTYSGNADGDLHIWGSIRTGVNWNEAGGTVYRVFGLSIIGAASLTVTPGIIVPVEPNEEIYVQGTLNATQVTFTKIPGGGEWKGIAFYDPGSSDSLLDSCIIEYAKGYSSARPAVIFLFGSSPTITGCTIINASAKHGFYLQNSSAPAPSVI